jgi:6-phosphogluconolactonase (cycloisomerase 2 family)
MRQFYAHSRSLSLRFGLAVLLLAFAAGCGSSHTATPDPVPSTNTLYTISNDVSGNTVIAFVRSPDGTLGKMTSYATGGLGAGHGLENQGALTLTSDNKHLLVVNPASNDLSVFQITSQGLNLTAHVSSGGQFPVSITEHSGVVYVLNRGSETGDPNGDVISGLRLTPDGNLTPIPGSTIPLSTKQTNAAQVGISPNGDLIVVTEHGAGPIDTYILDANGVPGNHLVQQSAGTGPFGFAFRSASELFVSEAGGGSTSSYTVDMQGTLHTISSAVSTQQQGSCWISITPDKRFAYVADTGSGTVSTFAIRADGSLSLVTATAATTQGRPLDMGITADGLYLNVLTTSGDIEVFRIDAASGGLSQIQVITGLPSGTNGLATF